MATETAEVETVDWSQRPGLAFGEAVKRRLEASGMSIKELAERVGCSRGYLHQVLRGDCAPPSEEFVLKVADVFGLGEEETNRWLYYCGRIRVSNFAKLLAQESFLRTLAGATAGLTIHEVKAAAGHMIQRMK
jgi:transcriptional regulator with XRE-family HTH domain